MMPPDPGAAYVRFYESLSPGGVANLSTYVADDVRFKDPFNDVVGVEAYRQLLAKMFEAVPDIAFKVSHRAIAGDACLLRWRCQGTLARLGAAPWVLNGMSELRFAPDGRVREHIDYWDAAAQFYERLPILGGLLRLIRRRVASH